MADNITKLTESCVLCGNITEFRVAEDHLNPQGESDLPPLQTKWYYLTEYQIKVLLFLNLIREWFMSFKERSMRWICIFTVFYLLKSECRNTSNCSTSVIKATLYCSTCDVIMTYDIIIGFIMASRCSVMILVCYHFLEISLRNLNHKRWRQTIALK